MAAMVTQILLLVATLPVVLVTCSSNVNTSQSASTPRSSGTATIESAPLATNIAAPAPPKTTVVASAAPVEQTNPTGLQSGVAVEVSRVIDGDTIEVNVSGRIYTVRYIGIDSPETVNPRTPIQCFGPEASQKNTELVAGKTVYLERDIIDTDRYGRLLRYVWLENQVLVNETLVIEGFAKADAHPDYTKHTERLSAAQDQARKLRNGMWGQCLYDNALTSVPTPATLP